MNAMLEQNTTLELVRRAQKGERVAFEELVAPIADRVLNAIRLGMGERLKGRVEPEDVLQDTFLRAWRSIERFEWQGQESFRRWLEGVASNLLLEAGKRETRHEVLEIPHEPQADQVSPSHHQRRKERFDRLQGCVSRLSPDQQTAVRLSRFEGLKIREVADRMGRSEAAVKSLLLRAMKELRGSFGDTESLGLPNGERGEGHGD